MLVLTGRDFASIRSAAAVLHFVRFIITGHPLVGLRFARCNISYGHKHCPALPPYIWVVGLIAENNSAIMFVLG